LFYFKRYIVQLNNNHAHLLQQQ